MKRFMSIMLALSFVLGTAAVTFGQTETTTTKKAEKKTAKKHVKKAKKTTAETK